MRQSEDNDIIDVRRTEMTKLWSEIHKTVSVLRGKGNDEAKKLYTMIREFRLDMVPEREAVNKQQELEKILGCQTTEELQILPPKMSKNKGSGKRMLSGKMKSVEKAKKQKRLCANCKQMAHHDKRNCPNPFSKKPPTHPQSSEDEESDEEGDDLETSSD